MMKFMKSYARVTIQQVMIKNHAIDELAEHSNPIFNTPRNDTIHEIQFRSEIMKFMTLTKSLANT